MEPTRYGWEAQARRTILSEEIELTTLPGFRVRARKFTVAAADEIRAAQVRKRDMLPPRLRSLIGRAAAEGKDLAALARELPEGEAEALLTDLPAEASSMSDIMRLSILHGIGEHNLDDQGRRDEVMTPALVDRLLEYPETTAELYGIVQKWNRPFAKTTPATSGMSSSGSTEEPPSPGERNSPTDGSPQG